jgi:hypothetical protein
MPSTFLSSGVAWLAAQIGQHAGQAVTVDVGTQHYTGLTATLAVREYDVEDAEGFRTAVQVCDWIFTSSDLGFIGVTLRVGAIITDGAGQRYEVLPPGPNKPAVETMDAGGMMTVVHTKKTGAE